MKNEISPLLSRTALEEVETQHIAVGRLVNILRERSTSRDNSSSLLEEARAAIYGLLVSPRPAVVSKACQGVSQLVLTDALQPETVPIVDGAEAIDHLMKAIQTAMARDEKQEEHVPLQKPGGGHRRQGAAVAQVMIKCLVDVMRARARQQASRERSGGGAGAGQHGFIVTLLEMNCGLIFPALSHEATYFLDRAGVNPKDVVCVVSPLTAAILLQPEYANLRGVFLLKLSTASTTASDVVKLCLIVLQVELLSFCAVHTEAHADVAASWCCALADAAISLDSDASWKRASRAVSGAIVSLIAEFRERGFSLIPLLAPLRSMAAAGVESLAAEVTFLGITALQTPFVDERDALLHIIECALRSMPLHEFLESHEQLWSLETLIYPVVSMAAAGNIAAAKVMTHLEAALSDLSHSYVEAEREDKGGKQARNNTNIGNKTYEGGVKSLRHRTAVAFIVRRLVLLQEDEPALVQICEGLRRRAEEHALLKKESARNIGDDRRDATTLMSSDPLELESALCLLSPVLLRPRLQRAHGAACAALVAVVGAVPTLGVRLLPFVLYAIRRLVGGVAPENGGTLPLLWVLPELGPHKVVAKQVASTVKALARAPQGEVRGLGLRLAARLIQVNSRTFEQLQLLLTKTPPDHIPPSPPESEESRICRTAGMLDVCMDEPELGLEFVRPIQGLLADPSPSVVALSVRAIAALIRMDCLDFTAALRIVTKKGKVAHTGGEADEDFGNPLVVGSLAEVCGAGAEAATMAAAETESSEEESEEGSEGEHESQWGMANAVEILLDRKIGSHPDESVRKTVYSSLAAHLPALLKAETGQEAHEDAAVLAPRVRAFLGEAMSVDPSLLARSSLHNAAKIILIAESTDPSTWMASSGRAAAAPGIRGAHGKEQSGPSNRLLAALPRPELVREAFHRDGSSFPGLAGAALWSYPARATDMTAAARRDAMARDLVELLAGEGAGFGLAPCPWQRAVTPLGIQRFVRHFFAACLAAELTGLAGDGNGTPEMAAAVKVCRSAIHGTQGIPQGLVAVAMASLVTCVPASCAHVAVEEISRALRRLRDSTSGDAHTLLDGEELFPLAAAMVTRALPAEAEAQATEAVEAIAKVYDDIGASPQAPVAGGDDEEIMSLDETQVSFWSCVAVGVASEWSVRHPTAPEASGIVSHSAQRLIVGLANTVGSDHIASIADACFGSGARPRNLEGQHPDIVEWVNIDVGSILLRRGGRSQTGLGIPRTARGSRCLSLFLGLCSVPAGLRATGLHRELLQVFHVVRALQEAGVCGSALCLPTVVSECLSCGIIDSPAILDCLRSLSVALDGVTSTRPGGERGCAAQDVCIGAAGLVASIHGKVVLPPGFVESMFERLRKAAANPVHRTGMDSGSRVASFLALSSLIGCPLLGVGEFVPRRLRVSPVANRRMVEDLLKTVRETMEGPSQRPKNAAARVWGCLSAVGQDERSVEDRVLQDALEWTEGGEMPASASCGFISPDALSVAREGKLMATVLTGLQAVARGKGNVVEEGKGTRADDGVEQAESLSVALLKYPSLFAASAMACLEGACSTLRLPHAQMAAVLGAIYRGGNGAHVEMRCISLALALVAKHQAYSSWLCSLFRGPLLVNISPETRRYLIKVFDRVALAAPPETVCDLMETVWKTLVPTLLARAPSDGPGSTGAVPGNSDKIIDEAAEFMSGLDKLVGVTASSAVGVAAEAMTIETILPSVLNAYAIRFDPSLLGGPMWDALVRLLARLRPERVRLAISFKPERSSLAASNAIRAYLVSRLAAAGGKGEGLGAVVKWATGINTDGEASIAVMPHLAEGIARIDVASSRYNWFKTLLDSAGLPEISLKRAAALLGRAAGTRVDSPVISGGSLVAGKKADISTGRGYLQGSLLYDLSFAAPSAVSEMEFASSGVSADLLTRLIRVSGLSRRSGSQSGKGATEEVGVDEEEEEVRLGLEGFVRGLRHAPQILNGTLSRQFASYAESIAAEEASLSSREHDQD